ncbi:protease complex subunit PrcB family protein [Gloeocapsopsis dulcis]|nr:protease complex subunit PrcB family protein [Gloeocapsopsis dulcis]WNN90005.1 protease complex subunit PrcB family protein [Gloeocapsopsis dulcis]
MDNSIDFELIDVGYNPLTAGFEPEPKIIVFRNQQEWKNFWSSFSFLDVNLNEQKFPVPAVNFEQKMVIGLTSGSRSTGGYSVQIDRIEQVQTPTPQWLIHYTEIIPGENCIVTQQPTTPTVFILTKNTSAGIQLSKQKLTSRC